MIDLERAAADLTTAVSHKQPDIGAVQARVQRRRHRRRIVGAIGAVVLLAAGGAAALTVSDSPSDQEQVRTDPGPTTPESGPTMPELAPSGTQFVDVGDLRIAVPADWGIEDAADGGGCGGPATIVVGSVAPNVQCSAQAALRLEFLEEPLHGGGGPPETRNGISVVPLASEPKEVWAVPDSGLLLTFSEETDPEPILATIAPSARQTALADVSADGVASWEVEPDAWKEVTYEGVALQVPASWEVLDGRSMAATSANCPATPADPPPVALGISVACPSAQHWQPRDGVWLRRVEEGEIATDDGTWEELSLGGLGGDEWTPIVQSWATSTLLHILVSAPDSPSVLVQIGLGPDGHVAGAILSSIRLDDSSTRAIVLPCGTEAVPDRLALDLPEDLVVEPAPGLGGWAPGTGEDICAVNLTDAEDPASHVTFVDGGIAYGIAEPRNEDGPREVVWGEIEDGFGGEYVNAEGDRVGVLAYGLSETGAALLFASIAAT